MKSCTASCKDATHNAETTNTKEDKNSIDCGGNECNYRNINLSNHENLSKAFARRGRIYLQLFLRNVSLPTTNKAETDDKIRDIFMRKPEMHDNDNHNDDDDDDDDVLSLPLRIHIIPHRLQQAYFFHCTDATVLTVWL